MSNPVIAIGIDAAERTVIEKWLDEGHLPVMQRLREQGAYSRVKNFPYYRAESPWNVFLTGVSPQKSGFWTELSYSPETYRTKFGIYDFEEFPPFYAVPKGKRVAVFDMPKTVLRDEVDGFQMLGWGAHAAATPSHSLPPEAYDDIIARHGKHPTYLDDHAILWNQKSFDKLLEGSLEGLRRRVDICKELLEREEWDFFLTLLGEAHSFGHALWHMYDPTHPYHRPGIADLLLKMFIELDTALGQIIEAAPDNAQIYVFSVHGMEPNNLDVTSCIFLPEVMYRFNFPDRQGYARGDINKPVPPVIPNGS